MRHDPAVVDLQPGRMERHSSAHRFHMVAPRDPVNLPVALGLCTGKWPDLVPGEFVTLVEIYEWNPAWDPADHFQRNRFSALVLDRPMAFRLSEPELGFCPRNDPSTSNLCYSLYTSS